MGKLTDRQIANLKPSNKDEFFSDGGGLYLRVRTSGGKFWLYRYKVGKTTKWIDIGTYPGLTLSNARAESIRLKLLRENGNDPAEHIKTVAAQREAAIAASKQAEVEASARITVTRLLDHWQRVGLKNRKDEGSEIRRYFEKDVIPVMGDVPVELVTRSMIAVMLDGIVERGAPIIARNLLSALRQMFTFAITREIVQVDPTALLKRDDYGKRNERTRVLSEHEIIDLNNKMSEARLLKSSELAIWLMLSTCCRIGELMRAKWEDIDIDAAIWRISADNSKNGKEHEVLLSNFSIEQFERLRAISGNCQWCYPAENKRGEHLCVKSVSKQIHDRQRTVPLKNRSKATGILLLAGGAWTPHDLRRTGATLMGSLGVRPDVIEKCLNHVEQNKLVRIYQRQELKPEQREAWRLLGDYLKSVKCGEVKI